MPLRPDIVGTSNGNGSHFRGFILLLQLCQFQATTVTLVVVMVGSMMGWGWGVSLMAIGCFLHLGRMEQLLLPRISMVEVIRCIGMAWVKIGVRRMTRGSSIRLHYSHWSPSLRSFEGATRFSTQR